MVNVILIDSDLEKNLDTKKTNSRMHFSDTSRTIDVSDISTEMSLFVNTDTNRRSTLLCRGNLYIIFDQHNRNLLSSLRSVLAMIEEHFIPSKEYRSQLVLDDEMITNRKKKRFQDSRLLVNMKYVISATHL